MKSIGSFFRQLMSDEGDLSMTRFLSMVCVFSAVLICVVAIVKEQPLDSAVGVISTFLAGGFGGKVVQSFAERETKPAKPKRPSSEDEEV